MNKKNISILILALVVLIGAVVFMARSIDKKNEALVPVEQNVTGTKNIVTTPENNIPKDNVTIDQMTKEQADFARDFANKTKAK